MFHSYRTLRVLLVTALLATNGASLAQDNYPNRPIRMILPFAAGGTGDGVMRTISQEMGRRLGQTIYADNVVGGTGIVGQDQARRSAPDGYTLVTVSISGGLAHHGLNRTVDYTKDFTMIGQVYSQYGLLVSNHHLPQMANIQNLRDLIAYARANPGVLNYASQGTGSVGHLMMERIKSLTGVRIEHVPYKGAAPAYTDLMAGHIQLMSVSLGALPYIESGKLRGIAIGSPTRSPKLPNTSTFIEEGLTGLIVGSWLGVAAPPGVPAEIANRLSNELRATIATPAVAQRLRQLGTEPEFLTGAEFAARANNDFRMWGEMLKQTKLNTK